MLRRQGYIKSMAGDKFRVTGTEMKLKALKLEKIS